MQDITLMKAVLGRHVKLLGCAVKSQIPKRFYEEIEMSNLYTLLTGKSTPVKYSHLKGEGKIVSFWMIQHPQTPLKSMKAEETAGMWLLPTVLLTDSIHIHRAVAHRMSVLINMSKEHLLMLPSPISCHLCLTNILV